MATAPKTHRPFKGSTPRQQYDKRRGSASERGYDHRWHMCRESYFTQNPLCEDCEADGLTVDKDIEVDHIIPINGRDDPLRLDMENLRSRCKQCHAMKTRMDVWIRGLFDHLMGDGVDYESARDVVIEKVAKERADES